LRWWKLNTIDNGPQSAREYSMQRSSVVDDISPTVTASASRP
jgi:hypothetical protein